MRIFLLQYWFVHIVYYQNMLEIMSIIKKVVVLILGLGPFCGLNTFSLCLRGF